MKKFICAICVLIPLISASQFKITGTVLEKATGHVLPGAHVQAYNTMLTTISDESGLFVFPKLKKGNYILQVSFVGFKKLQKAITLDRDTAIIFELEEEALLGEEVNITSTRVQEKSPGTYSLLSSREITRLNTGKDLPFIIQNTPSTVVTSDAGTGIGYTGISIRGTNLTRINVTVNGIPLNDAESQGVWFVDLPDIAASTENIQIQRGVGTSTNGAGSFGATINILTNVLNQEPYGEMTASGGSFGTFRGAVRFGTGLFGKNFAVDGRASWIGSEGYIDRASSDLKSYYLAGGYYGKETILKFITFSGTEKTYQAWEGVPKDSLATNRTFNPSGLYYDENGKALYYKDQTDNYKQDHYQLIFSQKLLPSWNLNLAFHVTRGFGFYENYKEDENFAAYGLENVILGSDTITVTDLVNRKYLDNIFYGFTFSSNYSHNEKLKITLGGAWNRYNGDHYGKIIWATYASNGNNDRNWYFNAGEKSDFNVFLKANYLLLKKLNLFADLQYRNVGHWLSGTLEDQRWLAGNYTYNFFNPKFGLYYEFSKKHAAYFSFGIANREPSRNNYKDADAGKVPSPERLYDCELGYGFSSKPVHAELNLYYMKYRDQLVLTGEINSVGEPVMVNVPDSYRSGIEITATWNIIPELKWSLNGAFSVNKINDFSTYIDSYDENWNYLGQAERHMGTSTLSFSPGIVAGSIITGMPFNGFSVSLISKYVGKQYIDNTKDESRSLDGYFVNDITMQYHIQTRFVKEIVLNASIGNITSTKYESNAWVYPYLVSSQSYEVNGYFPQALINFMAGITLRL